MARAIWKGSLSFGLVNIPVELYSAVRDNRPHFHLLHAKDRSPIKYERVCEKEHEAVPWNDVVKGFEYERGRYVLMTKEDFQAAALEKSRTIDIIDFVKSAEIDDRFFETSYYLVPPKGGERAYALMREALRESDRVGIAKMILRESQHLAAITVHEQALVLTMMRFADEVVDLSAFEFPGDSNVRPKELDMAKTLVGSLAGPWSPDKYTDEYRTNLMRIIEAKVSKREPELESAEPEQSADVVDLMERLRRSLGQVPAGKGAKKARKAGVAQAGGERRRAAAADRSGAKTKAPAAAKRPARGTRPARPRRHRAA